MKTRLGFLVDELRDSYWFTPGLMTAASGGLALVLINLDSTLAGDELPRWLRGVLFAGGPNGARAVLQTVASSMITVAGVVFSITIVVLALASGQFGPRLLDNFMRDRGTQVTLGTFVGSFLYSLLVLRTIQTDAPEQSVPHLSVTVALILAVAGLCVLIYYIHHISVEIQAPELVASVGHDIRERADELYPKLIEPDTATTTMVLPVPRDALEVAAVSNGYVQLVDLEQLVSMASDNDVTIRLETRPGRFLVTGVSVASVWPASRVDDRFEHELVETVVIGRRRTHVQDIEFPIRQLAEVAVRALSPAINDPFTAVNCVDHLAAGLCMLAGRILTTDQRDRDGVVRVVLADPVTFDELVASAYDQIRQSAGFHAKVYVRLLESLNRIAGRVRSPDRLEPLLAQGRLVVEAAELAVPSEADRLPIRQAHDALVIAVNARRPELDRDPDLAVTGPVARDSQYP